MNRLSLTIFAFALLVFVGCNSTPSTAPDNKAVPGITFETALNPDGSITLFKINDIPINIMPMTDTRPLSSYETDIKNDAANFDDYLMLTALYYSRNKPGDMGQAIKYCDMALNIRKDHPQALYARGLCYFKAGESTKALNDLQAVLKMNIQTPIGVYYVMGMIYYLQSDYTAALNAFEQVKKLNPKFADTEEVLEVLKGAVNCFLAQPSFSCPCFLDLRSRMLLSALYHLLMNIT